jgi:hypothetical protein
MSRVFVRGGLKMNNSSFSIFAPNQVKYFLCLPVWVGHIGNQDITFLNFRDLVEISDDANAASCSIAEYSNTEK